MTHNSRKEEKGTDKRLELAEDEIETLMWEAQVLDSETNQHEERLREIEAAVREFDERLERLEEGKVP